MTNKNIRVGIVGMGNWAQYGHLPSLKLLPEYDVTVIAVGGRSMQRELLASSKFRTS